jgi:AcrR family transcriptional regulator
MTAQTQAGDGTGPPSRRRYRSARRAQQASETRSAILEAATRLFTANGWVATGVRDIAREAGVATETVYSHFSSKTALLQQVIDVAAGGDDAPLAVAERPEFISMGDGDRGDRITAAAAVVTEIHLRTCGLAKVVREAAATDEAIAGMLATTREQQRLDTESGVALVMGRQPLPAERDALWALLSVEVYLLLVEVTGWTPQAYEAWVAATLDALLPRS